MLHYILVENGEQGRYTAQVLGWPGTTVQGTTRHEVLTQLRQQITTRLQQVEIVPMEIETSPTALHPWMKFAGMFQDDPLFDQVVENIEEYRRELDQESATV